MDWLFRYLVKRAVWRLLLIVVGVAVAVVAGIQQGMTMDELLRSIEREF